MIGTEEDQASFFGSAGRLLITHHCRGCIMRHRLHRHQSITLHLQSIKPHRLHRHRSITLHLQPIMPHRLSIGVAITNTKAKAMMIRRQLDMTTCEGIVAFRAFPRDPLLRFRPADI